MAAEPRRVRIALPREVISGETVRVKTLISHPMETGYRRDAFGGEIPRKILVRFRCFYREELIVDETLRPGVAANPFLSFAFRATETGPVRFEWTDQDGTVTQETRELLVG